MVWLSIPEFQVYVLIESAPSTHISEHFISGEKHRGEGGYVSHPVYVFFHYLQKIDSVKLNIPSNFPVQFSSFFLFILFIV